MPQFKDNLCLSWPAYLFKFWMHNLQVACYHPDSNLSSSLYVHCIFLLGHNNIKVAAPQLHITRSVFAQRILWYLPCWCRLDSLTHICWSYYRVYIHSLMLLFIYIYLANSKRNLCTYAQISTDLNISNRITSFKKTNKILNSKEFRQPNPKQKLK